MQIRGGSSKGVFIKASDLPSDVKQRDEILLSVMGRDDRQIDGLGGSHPLTSKVAIVGPSTKEDVDVDYLFVQVVVGQNRVDSTPNCGNILSGVGAFAIESGMVKIHDETTMIRVNMLNSDKICELVVQTPNGEIEYEGNTKIDGVPGSAAPVICRYLDIAGSICGSLFPTGKYSEKIDGVNVTCIDNGMPVVVIRANDLGKNGYETCPELSLDKELLAKVESIRLEAGTRMGLGDVTSKVIPKMTLISEPREGGNICTRTFIPHTCHSSIGVLGAVSVATACIFPKTVAHAISVVPQKLNKQMSVEHPSGEFSVELICDESKGDLVIKKAGLLRTARILCKGEVYYPSQNYN
ncbi:MAG: 4-oxalomesaconate tautomerase [Sulfurimonas sp.]|jgi:4-oxalomesaconate tautomerase